MSKEQKYKQVVGRLIIVLAIISAIITLWLRHTLTPRRHTALAGVEQLQQDVPAYGREPVPSVLPATLSPEQFDKKEVKEAYAIAGQLKKVLYGLPCYCRCDRSQGHRHLLDCFTSYHGARCWACQQEARFAYSESRKGKTVEQIREAIIHGDWQKSAQ
jgi:Protein of unknown function with PCYCGC motif